MVSEASMSDDQRPDDHVTIYGRIDNDPFTGVADEHCLSVYPYQRIAAR